MKDLVKLMKDLNERIANFFGYTTKPDTRIYRRCAKCGLGTKEVPCDRCGDPREKGVTGFFPSEDEVELFEVVAFTHKMKEDRQKDIIKDAIKEAVEELVEDFKPRQKAKKRLPVSRLE